MEGADGGRLGRALAPAAQGLRGLAALPARLADALLVDTDQQMGIGELDLQGDFDELMRRHRELKTRVDQLGESVRRAQAGNAVEVNRQYADAIVRLAELMSDAVKR